MPRPPRTSIVFFGTLKFAVPVLLLVAGGLIFLFNQNNDSIPPPPLAQANPQHLLKNLPTTATAQSPELKLLFFGDLMLDRHIKEKMGTHGISYLFEKLTDKEIFSHSDLASANLEGAITKNGAHYPPKVTYDFAFDPKTVAGLKEWNFNFFNLANNHLTDQGQKGIKETRDNLIKLGIGFAGSADGVTDKNSSQSLDLSKGKVGLAGFSMVYQKFNLAEAVKIVKKLREGNEAVVVNIHWGQEYQHQFSKEQQETGHKLIEAGADLIVGHHPHVVQGMEIYQNRPIFYSLGNFVFDQYFSAATQEGLAVQFIKNLSTSAPKTEFHLLPFKASGSQIEWLDEKEKNIFWQKFINWSKLGEREKEMVKNGILTVEIRKLKD